MRILLGLAVLAIVAAPVSANLLDLVSGGFENTDPATGGAWPIDGTGHQWQGAIERNSTIWGPGAAYSGEKWGSIQSGGASFTKRAWIQSFTVPPSESVTLTGVRAGGHNGDGTQATLFVQLIDGCGEGGAVLGQWSMVTSTTGGFGWTPFMIGPVHPNAGGVTIRFGITVGGGWSNGTALHLDSLELTPEPASMALFGLAGLPLLLRRRR